MSQFAYDSASTKVSCVSEGVSAILMGLPNVCRHTRLMRLPHFTVCLFLGVAGAGVFRHVGWLYICPIQCSHNVQSRA